MSHDPATPLAYASAPVPPAMARFFLSPLGWPFFLTCSLVTLWILFLARVPESFTAGIVYFFATAGLGFVWFFRLVMRFFFRKIYPEWIDPRSALARFGLPLAFPVVLLGCLYFELPFRAALQISKPALEREAKLLLAAGPGAGHAWTHKTLGVFEVNYPDVDPDLHAVRFTIAGAGFIDEVGVAYSPDPLPARHGRTQFTRLSGPWYTFDHHW